MKKLFIIMLAAFIFVGCKDKKDETAVYTVTFNVNGGSPAPEKQTVEAGQTATAPNSPSKQGYIFLFWSLDNATTAYNFQTPVTGNITLVANWQDEADVEYWQVTWQLNYGAWASGYTPPAQVVKGGTLAEPTNPVKAGNTFGGWYKEAALTNKVAFPYNVSSLTADFTLYAKWENESGGTSVITVNTVEQLRAAFASGGTKTIQLAAGEYIIKSIRGSLPNALLILPNTNITILPPASGTATLKATADTNHDIFQVHNNGILTMGWEGSSSGGNIVVDGSLKPRNDHECATGELVSVYSGSFIMYNGVSLTHNSYPAVYVGGGTFEMKGGIISNNRTNDDGAGVRVNSGEFIMEAGLISENTTFMSGGSGGGVRVGFSDANEARFVMKGGVIMKNVAASRGGGVYIRSGGVFVIEKGNIQGYSASNGNSNKAGASNTSGAALYNDGGSAKDGNGVSFPTSVNMDIIRE